MSLTVMGMSLIDVEPPLTVVKIYLVSEESIILAEEGEVLIIQFSQASTSSYAHLVQKKRKLLISFRSVLIFLCF